MEEERELQPDWESEEPQEEIARAIPEPELFGAPSISPSFYHCKQCNEDVLAQDVVWDREDQPHCPQCNATLERWSD